ncbi:unnamed protein product [marine sediment metagenome]|uniref:Uncharacterized protein n=1 Tax=marine sediment metagenome TaxID=412755 RepID=X1RU89_9ZZZZ
MSEKEKEEMLDPRTKLTEDKDVLLLCGIFYTVKKGERINEIMDLFANGKIKMDDEKTLFINDLNHHTFCAQVEKVKFIFI